jgi:hypothetical protein
VTLNMTAFFILLVLIMNAQIFSATASNPLGVNGAQEAFYVFLGLWAFKSVVLTTVRYAKVPSIDLFIFVTPLVLIAYGATAAFITFKQPIAFGILEERRILSVYVYFPLVDMLRSGRISAEKMEKAILTVMAICAVLMVAVSFKLIPAWNEVRSSNVALRSERLSIGSSFLAAFLPLLLVRLRGTEAIKRITIFILLAFALVFITQSRQLLIAIALMITLTLRPHVLLALGAAITITILLFMPFLSEQLQFYTELFSQLFSSKYLDSSWRMLSIEAVIQSLRAGEIFGHGSLSSMWQEGFQRVIGESFFLADIGIIGTSYRYGLLGIFWYLFWMTVQLTLIMEMPAASQRRRYFAVLLFLVILLPVAAPIEYRGFVTGVLFAMTAFLSSQNKQNKISGARRTVSGQMLSETA